MNLKIKIFWIDKKKKRGWDESECIIGRNASLGGCWHVPHISRLINPVMSFLFYICDKWLTETINGLCLKSIKSLLLLYKITAIIKYEKYMFINQIAHSF